MSGVVVSLCLIFAFERMVGHEPHPDPDEAFIISTSADEIVRDVEALVSGISTYAHFGYDRVRGIDVKWFQNQGIARYARAPVSGVFFDTEERPASHYGWEGNPDAVVLELRLWGMAHEACDEAAKRLNDSRSPSRLFPRAKCDDAGPELTYVFM